MKLKNNAIFIADSHYNHTRIEVFKLLADIKNGKILTSQLFLMGDIFDFLSNEIIYFKFQNNELISLINHISNKVEIVYLEGNHDFNLKDIFSNVTVIPRELQPIKISYDKRVIALSHGDIFTPFSYNLYTIIFRSHYFQKFLNIIDINFKVSKYFEQKLINKSICHKQDNFDDFIKKRKLDYDADLIIEGHYHQGYIDDRYINIPSFHCKLQYLSYQNNIFKFCKY